MAAGTSASAASEMQGGPPDDDDWFFDPDLAAMSRSLRREIREEAEEVESIVGESELRARTMTDVVMEARNRGDVLAVATNNRVFTGRLIYAARDFLTMQSQGFQTDLNLAGVSYVRVIERGTRLGGLPGEDGPGTFEMRLLERRSPIERVELGYQNLQETLMCYVQTVGQDHVVVTNDQREELSIPLTAISWILRRKRTR